MSLLFHRDKSGSLRTYHLQGRELGEESPRNGGEGGGICMKDSVLNREERVMVKAGSRKEGGNRSLTTPHLHLFISKKTPKRKELLAESIPQRIHIHYF